MAYSKDYPEQLKKCGCGECKDCVDALFAWLCPPSLSSLADKLIIKKLDETLQGF